MRALRVTIDFGGLDPTDDEFASVEDFAEYLCDDDQTEFEFGLDLILDGLERLRDTA